MEMVGKRVASWSITLNSDRHTALDNAILRFALSGQLVQWSRSHHPAREPFRPLLCVFDRREDSIQLIVGSLGVRVMVH